MRNNVHVTKPEWAIGSGMVSTCLTRPSISTPVNGQLHVHIVGWASGVSYIPYAVYVCVCVWYDIIC